MLKLTAVIIITCTTTLSYSQPLSIGDPLKNMELLVANYPTGNIKTDELRGKAVLLCFWSHICTSCLRSFPKLQDLQQEFRDSLQIILVNRESQHQTEKFFEKYKNIPRPDLPMISGDTMLHNLFPHYGVPYDVWIDRNGIVRALTEGYNANSEKIRRFIKDSGIDVQSFSVRKSVPSLFDPAVNDRVNFYSYIGNCMDELSIQPADDSAFAELILNCSSILRLYQMAFSEGAVSIKNRFLLARPGRTVLELDTARYGFIGATGRSEKQWLQNYGSHYRYTYHLRLPKSDDGSKYRLMQNDLARYFNLDASLQIRRAKALVLVSTGDRDVLRSRGGERRSNFSWKNLKTTRFDSSRFFINVPFRDFATSFGEMYIESNFDKPFVDATGIDFPVDIRFSGATIDAFDLPRLRKELNQYNLDLVEQDYPLEVLVIRKTNGGEVVPSIR